MKGCNAPRTPRPVSGGCSRSHRRASGQEISSTVETPTWYKPNITGQGEVERLKKHVEWEVMQGEGRAYFSTQDCATDAVGRGTAHHLRQRECPKPQRYASTG